MPRSPSTVQHAVEIIPLHRIGVQVNARVTPIADNLLRAEANRRRQAIAGHVSVGTLVTEAVIAHFGPEHPELLGKPARPSNAGRTRLRKHAAA